MSVTKAQKLRLGIFVAVGLAAIIGGLVVLAGMKLGEERDIYQIRFGDAAVSLSGMEVGSPVKYSGIRVGRVESIKVDPEDVGVIVVVVTLDHETPVAEDTQANLGSLGITGLKYVELTRGSAGARIRDPGETIPAGKSFVDTLTDQAGEIATKVGVVLDRIASLTDDKMKTRISSVLDRSDKLLSTVEATVTENRESFKKLSERMVSTADKVERLGEEVTGTAERVNSLLDEMRPRIVRVLDESAGTMAKLREASGVLKTTLGESEALMREARTTLGDEGLRGTLANTDQVLERVSALLGRSREDVLEAVAYLRDTAENMSGFAERVREDPSLLLTGDSEGGEFK